MIEQQPSLSEEVLQDRVRHGLIARGIGAVILGIIVGTLLPAAFQVGISYHFPDEKEAQTWGFILWGEHWAIRVVVSWAGIVAAGFIVGLVARKKGSMLAALASIPTLICWLAIAAIGWTEQIPFMSETRAVDISIGNKLAASLLVLTTIPFAIWSGNQGEEISSVYGEYFDSRRWTLLGIKWFHFIWIPLLVYIVMMQTSYVALYGFQWLKAMWRADASFISVSSIVPTVFTLMVWGTLYIMWFGMFKSYMALSGLDEIPSSGARAIAVLKYGVGGLILAAVLQAGIAYLHYGLIKLLS